MLPVSMRCAAFSVVLISIVTPGSVLAEDRWHASVIRVAGKAPVEYVEDYASSKYGAGWDFTQGNDEAAWTIDGVQAKSLRNGKLNFVTLKNTSLYLGNKSGLPDGALYETINQKWNQESSPWVVRIKLAQSAKVSEWRIRAFYSHFGRKPQSILRKLTLKGEQSQIVVVPMGSSARIFSGISIDSMTPGNKVSIDWVRVERLSAKRYFRKVINLSSDPIAAGFALSSNARYSIYINGKKVDEHGGRMPFQRRINKYDGLEAYFSPGQNVIAIESEAYSGTSSPARPGDHFFLQGMLITKDGEVLNLQSDSSWKAAYHVDSARWNEVKYNDSSWKKAVNLGTVTSRKLDASKDDGAGGFMEPPYFGRIKVVQNDNPFPILKEGAQAFLPVKVVKANEISGSIRYQVKNAGSGAIVQEGERALEDIDSDYLSGTIAIDALQQGPYQLTLSYHANGKALDSRVLEVIVVGPIPQQTTEGAFYEDGMELQLIHSFSPAELFSNNQFIKDKKFEKSQKVIRNMQGLLPWNDPGIISLAGQQFVESGAYSGAWLSFKYSVQHLYKPHLVEIEYPFDRERNNVFVLAEGAQFRNLGKIGADAGVPRAIGGVYLDKSGIAQNRSEKFRMIFWPNRKQGTLTLVNAGRTRIDRAAIGKVNIYQIVSDLPAMKSGLLNNDKVMFGPFLERVDRTLPGIFYTGPLAEKFTANLKDGYFYGYYAAWYNTIENLIKYLKFSGQNTLFAGVYMYSGGWFPSRGFQGEASSGANYQGAGWDGGALALMARMFEENGLNLVLGVQFSASPGLLAQDDVTDVEVRAGAESLRFITRSGIQARGLGTFNFLKAPVKQEMLSLADEITARFSSYPSIKGVTWMRSPRFAPATNDPAAQDGGYVGYGDYTVSLFQQESGIQLPLMKGDNRYMERYNWLRENAWNTWLHWRADKVAALDAELAGRFLRKRKDWVTWRFTDYPSSRETLELWQEGTIGYADFFYREGIDPALYNGKSHLRLVPVVNWTGGRLYRDKLGKKDMGAMLDRYNTDSGLPDLFGPYGTFLRIGFMTERTLSTNDDWLWKRLRVVANTAPDTAEFARQSSSIFQNMKPQFVPLGWSDGGFIMGHEQEIRNLGNTLLLQ